MDISDEELVHLQKNKPLEFAKLYKSGLSAQVALARQDQNAFAEWVLRDEKTQEHIRQAPYHLDMHKFLDDTKFAVVWGHVESGRCVTASSRFWDDNAEPVTTLELRDRFRDGKDPHVWTVDPGLRAWRKVRVKSVFYNGRVPCQRIYTDDGHVTTVSANHPFLTVTKVGAKHLTFWREAINLTRRDKVIAPLTHPIVTGGFSPSDQDAIALGFVLGLARFDPVDVTDPNFGISLRYTGTPLDVYAVQRMAQMISAQQGWIYREDQFEGERLAFTLMAPRESVRGWLERLGVQLAYEHKDGVWCRTTHAGAYELPRWTWTCEPSACRQFLVGLMAPFLATGITRDKNVVTKIAVPRTPGEGIRTLLQRVGVHVRLRAPMREYVWGEGPSWSHFVRQLVLFRGPGNDHFETTLTKQNYTQPRTINFVRVQDNEDVGEMPTWGVEIDDPQHTHVTDGILTHNTQQVSIGRVLRKLGQDKTSRIVIIQSSADLAKDTVTAIKSHIETNERLHLVYPDLKPGKLWTTHALTIERPEGIRTPSVQARGVFGKILGNRYDLIIGDDLLTLETTRTPYMRARLKEWFIKEPLSRLLRGGGCVILGNAQHRLDLMHELAKEAGWQSRIYPVRDPITKVSNWPERWPQERIEEYERTRSPAEVARALDCIARSDEDARFKNAWIEKALQDGRGLFGDLTFAYFLPQHYDEKTFVATGVDLAFTKTQKSDYTVLFTAAFHPNGTVDVLDIQRGRWSQDEILQRMVDVNKRFGATLFVESNLGQIAYQGMLKQYDPDFPVYPHFTLGHGTRTNKYHAQFGVEALAHEMSQGLWRFPTTTDGEAHPDLRIFMGDLLDYNPTDHVADTVMAAWICLRGARDRGGYDFSFEMLASTPEQVERDRLASPALLESPEQFAARFAEQAAKDLWDAIHGATHR